MSSITRSARHSALAAVSTAFLCAPCARAHPGRSATQKQPASAGAVAGKQPTVVFLRADKG